MRRDVNFAANLWGERRWIAFLTSLRDFAVRGFSFLGLASQASGCRRVATENTLQCSVEEKLETAIYRTA